MSKGAGRISDIDLDEVASGLRDGSLVLVDVREPHEFAAGYIPGSISRPLSSFDPRGLPAEDRVVFSCAAGVRSKTAIEISRAAGLDFCEHFPGGFKGWVEAGEPVARGSE